MSPEVPKPSFNQPRPGGEIKKMPERPVAPSPKEAPKDKSIFGGKPFIERRENFRSWAMSDDAFRKTGIPQQERVKITQELFNKDFLKPGTVEKTLKDLRAKQYSVSDQKEKDEINRKIRFIEKGILGK